VALALAQQVGIPPERVVAGATPAGKLERLKQLKAGGSGGGQQAGGSFHPATSPWWQSVLRARADAADAGIAHNHTTTSHGSHHYHRISSGVSNKHACSRDGGWWASIRALFGRSGDDGGVGLHAPLLPADVEAGAAGHHPASAPRPSLHRRSLSATAAAGASGFSKIRSLELYDEAEDVECGAHALSLVTPPASPTITTAAAAAGGVGHGEGSGASTVAQPVVVAMVGVVQILLSHG
jgi:hypothetical protein